MKEVTNAESKPCQFSLVWFFVVALAHFAISLAIAGMFFLAGMAAFSQDTSHDTYMLTRIQWVWTPLAMAAWNPDGHGGYNEGPAIFLALVWSFLIGVVAGFVLPALLRPFRSLPASKPKHPTDW